MLSTPDVPPPNPAAPTLEQWNRLHEQFRLWADPNLELTGTAHAVIVSNRFEKHIASTQPELYRVFSQDQIANLYMTVVLEWWSDHM